MAFGSKTCFVISPIGDPDTEIRQLADDVYDLVVLPALQKYQFEVVRADKIARPSVITAEIIQLVQEAELCIIDLTYHNPNVFYECGRRHETGRPFIQIIKKGDPLPFDLSGIRTVMYDVSTARTVHDSVQQIQQFVDEFEREGYGTQAAGVSLSTLAASLDRIERRLSQGVITGSSPESADSLGLDMRQLLNPRQAYMEAVISGNLDAALRLLPRLEQLLGPSGELISAAGILAVAGQQAGADIILRVLSQHEEQLDVESLKMGIGSLVQFYGLTDREREGMPVIEPIVMRVLQRRLAAEDEAFFLNQLQKLAYGAGDFTRAASLCEQVLRLNPTEPAYLYNASLIYDRLGQTARAVEAVDKYMELGTEDADHLAHAVEVYVQAGATDKARAAFAKLQTISRQRAAVLMFNPRLRSIIVGNL